MFKIVLYWFSDIFSVSDIHCTQDLNMIIVTLCDFICPTQLEIVIFCLKCILLFHSVLFFNPRWWYEVQLHRRQSFSIVSSSPFPSLLPPTIALSMSWCFLAKLCVVFLVLLFLAWYLQRFLSPSNFLVSVRRGQRTWVSWILWTPINFFQGLFFPTPIHWCFESMTLIFV